MSGSGGSVLSYPILSYPILSYTTLPYPILYFTTPIVLFYNPILSYPTLPYPILPYPTLPYPTLSYTILYYTEHLLQFFVWAASPSGLPWHGMVRHEMAWRCKYYPILPYTILHRVFILLYANPIFIR